MLIASDSKSRQRLEWTKKPADPTLFHQEGRHPDAMIYLVPNIQSAVYTSLSGA